MSRIAGISDRRGSVERSTQASLLVEQCRARSDWVSSILEANYATLGWCGRRKADAPAVEGIVCVLDGHIYNTRELGADEGAAALISRLYLDYGILRMLELVNGDFAVALYDPRSEVLWLARDRCGVRPLYYTLADGRLAFASRPHALLTLPGVSKDVNRRFVGLYATCHYRYFDNQPQESPYDQIHQLPAASLLCFTGSGVQLKRYWSLSDAPEHEEPEVELAERYRDLLLDAVALRLRCADRPLFTLSGGMDSSSVLVSADRAAGEPQPAASVVYDDPTYDESGDILSLVEARPRNWVITRIGSPDIFALIEEMIAAHDEPVGTATWLSHYLLCERARQEGFSSLFGGLGGDELNAGEYEYFLYHFADMRVAGRTEELRREVEMWVRHHDHPVFRKSLTAVEEGFKRLVDLTRPGRCLPDRLRLMRWSKALSPDWFRLETFEPVMECPFASYLKNRAYQDLYRETAPCCLRAEDRQASAFGLDHFLPFLDHRLVEFLFRVNGALKIRNGVTKRLLREAMRGLVPEATRSRVKKTGWNAPAHRWFSGKGREKLMDLVSSRAFRERGIYEHREVLRLIDEHEHIVSSGEFRENHMMFLWQLVNLELWLRTVGGTAKGMPLRPHISASG
jgi:asparagine synthase (glutamine-hydrolysing)